MWKFSAYLKEDSSAPNMRSCFWYNTIAEILKDNWESNSFVIFKWKKLKPTYREGEVVHCIKAVLSVSNKLFEAKMPFLLTPSTPFLILDA